MKKEIKNKKFLFGILTMVWVAIIFSFSLQTGEESGDMSSFLLMKLLHIIAPKLVGESQDISAEQLEILHLLFRKCAHFTEYFILGVLSISTVLYSKWRRMAMIGLAFCVGIASMDEILQLFVNGRVGSLWDVLIDSAGATAGIFALLFISGRAKRKNKPQ